MTLLVDACPECTSGDTYRRAAERFAEQPYRCRECGHEFAEPIRRHPRTGGLSPAGRAAEDAQPSTPTEVR